MSNTVGKNRFDWNKKSSSKAVFNANDRRKPVHLLISFLCNCEYVRVHISGVPAVVCVDDVHSVDGQALVRVNGNQDDSLTAPKHPVKPASGLSVLQIHVMQLSVGSFQSRLSTADQNQTLWTASEGAELITAVRVDQPEVREAHFQVMQQRRLVQVAESCQVI